MPEATVELPPELARACNTAAAAAAPREFVGALGGQQHRGAFVVQMLWPLTNTAEGTEAFAVAAADFAAATAALLASGCPFLGFVHSHPGGAPRPSARDRAELWSDCLQLIVADGAFGAFVRHQATMRELPLRVSTGRILAPCIQTGIFE